MKRPTKLISKIKHCSNGEFQDLHDYIIFLENLTKIQRAKTIDSETFDLEKHDVKIRADERQKFAEWLTKSDYANGYFDTENGFVSVDRVLAEYEKEEKE